MFASEVHNELHRAETYQLNYTCLYTRPPSTLGVSVRFELSFLRGTVFDYIVVGEAAIDYVQLRASCPDQ